MSIIQNGQSDRFQMFSTLLQEVHKIGQNQLEFPTPIHLNSDKLMNQTLGMKGFLNHLGKHIHHLKPTNLTLKPVARKSSLVYWPPSMP